MESEQPNNSTTSDKSVLRALCIISGVNTSVCLLAYGIGLLSMFMVARMPYADYEALFQQQAAGLFDAEVLARSGDLLHIIHEHGVALLAILLARTVVRMIGVVLMWRGRMLGFHVYAVAQLVGIFLPHLVLPWAFLGFFGPLLAVAMTALYGAQRRLLE
ncbi:MAG: hypothetical protein ABI432_02675 [Flavobacteriales bacterium]